MSDRPPHPQDERTDEQRVAELVRERAKVPPVQVVEPHWNDSTNDPVTSPGFKLTPEQLAQLRGHEAANAPTVPTVAYVKDKQAKATRELQFDDLKWFVATLCTVGAFLFSAGGWAADKFSHAIDGGVAPLEKRVGKLEEAQNKIQEEQQRARLEGVRTTVMLEQLTEKFRLPVPPVSDGGR